MHLGPFSRYVIGRIDEQIETIDNGAWVARPVIAPDQEPIELAPALVA